jgi:hypothetical protein
MRDGKEPVSDGTRGDGIAGRVGIDHVLDAAIQQAVDGHIGFGP